MFESAILVCFPRLFVCVTENVRYKKVTKYVHSLQGKQLYNNQAAGIVVTNQSLVLQSITRARAGLYTCVGHNQEGDGESNPVQLDVKCK